MEEEQMQTLKKDIVDKFRTAQNTFGNAPKEDADFLKKFSFICTLSFDVYLKKMIIEKMIDGLAQTAQDEERKRGGKGEKA